MALITYGVTCTTNSDGAAVKDIYLLITDEQKSKEFIKTISEYLNTRPDAPAWLWSLSDFISKMPCKDIPGMKKSDEKDKPIIASKTDEY